MKKLFAIPILALVLMGCSGTQLHQATVAEHDFKIAVQGFQNAEVAEFQSGHIDQQLHQQISGAIVQIGLGGQQVATLLQSGDMTGALKTIQTVDTSIAVLQSEGVLHISNPTSQAILSSALLAVQGVVTGVEVALTK